MKVTHMTSVHSPFDARIFYKECQTLVKAGYEVILIAPHNQDEVVDGVRIHAISKPRNRHERMTHTVWEVYRAALREDALIYHFHDPELIGVGALLRLRGKQVIYDAHEDASQQNLHKRWIPHWLRGGVSKAVAAVEWGAAKVLSGIVAATPAIGSRFSPSRTVVVQNFPMQGELTQNNGLPYAQRPMKIVYVGVISEFRGVREMIQAMDELPEHLEARLMLAGNCSPHDLENEVRGLPGWTRVKFLGWLNRRGVRALLGEARVGLVVLHPISNYVESYPTKLFEYMSAGLPVVASDFPLWRKIVEGSGAGLLVDPLNPSTIAKAIQWLLEHPEEAERMGKRGQEAVHERYNWDLEVKKLMSFYEELAR